MQQENNGVRISIPITLATSIGVVITALRRAEKVKTPRLKLRVRLLAVLIGLPVGACAEEALVAVATNFVTTLETLLPEFEAANHHEVRIAGGSTGKLYAQILRGAPFDAFLAADQERPQRLEATGHALPGSRFTYARGRLALWSRDTQAIMGDGIAALSGAEFRKLAIANPRTAPYGAAAKEALEALGLLESLATRLVMGENVGQAYAFVATGSAELGLVALSGVLSHNPAGSRWDVPSDLHAPIRQDAVLLVRGESNPVARELFAYLRSPEVKKRISALGYDMEE